MNFYYFVPVHDLFYLPLFSPFDSISPPDGSYLYLSQMIRVRIKMVQVTFQIRLILKTKNILISAKWLKVKKLSYAPTLMTRLRNKIYISYRSYLGGKKESNFSNLIYSRLPVQTIAAAIINFLIETRNIHFSPKLKYSFIQLNPTMGRRRGVEEEQNSKLIISLNWK